MPIKRFQISDSTLLTYFCLQILPYAITTHIVSTIKPVIYAITAIIRFYQPFDKLLIAHLPNLIRLVHAQPSSYKYSMLILYDMSYRLRKLLARVINFFVLIALL
jgi:hypothetical protein